MGNPARRGTGKYKTRQRKIIRRGSEGQGDHSWLNVNAEDVRKLVCVCSEVGLSATLILTRDRTAIGVRFWYPNIDIEQWYGGIEPDGRLPDDLWDYLDAILDECEIKPPERVEKLLRGE